MGTVQKRLWKVGGLIAIFQLTLAITNFFLPAGKTFDSHMYGHDFLPFYTAGQLVRSGHADQLYDPAAVASLERQTIAQAKIAIDNQYGAFLNPPFAALPAAWLAAWPYRAALAIWSMILGVFLIASVILLVNMLPDQRDWRWWGLIPVLLFAALPVWQAAIHAQNTFFSLFVLALTANFWRSGRALAAGLSAGLLLFKPQIGAVVAVALIVSQGRRALVGLSITGAALALVSALTMPGAMVEYLTKLSGSLRAVQMVSTYPWHRHVTFLAWWRMLIQGHTGGLPTAMVKVLSELCALLVAVTLAAATWKIRAERRRVDRLIAATLVAMPLLMPYYLDYDLTLLAVAAVLCAADAMANGVDRPILVAWVILYVAAEANAMVAGASRFIPVVPALAVLATILISRVNDTIAAQTINRRQIESTPPLARAA
jgi:alpha-1,2-mannosyltransferase